ncbi:hypothetical protein ACFX15_029333 [Malus domestica]
MLLSRSWFWSYRSNASLSSAAPPSLESDTQKVLNSSRQMKPSLSVSRSTMTRLSLSPETLEPRVLRSLPSSLTEILPLLLASKLLKTFWTSLVTTSLGLVEVGL